jgi:hypothetical protein
MFTSKQQLTGEMGIDPALAAFFVDRKVPVNNHYWKGRLLYVARGTGYMFIPLFFDLQLRAGIESAELMTEEYVQKMEQILDFAAQFEFGILSFNDHIDKIKESVIPEIKHSWLFEELNEYFSRQPLTPLGNIGTDNPALNRGDALLYLLCLRPEPEEVIKKIITYWYLLVPSFLLMDDLMDFHEDKQKQEENSLSHYGFNAEGVQIAVKKLETNFRVLEKVNPALGLFFQRSLDKKKRSEYFQTLLNN